MNGKEKQKFRDTKVGQWLTEKAPEVIESIGDNVPDGGLLDIVASVVRGKSNMDPATKLEFERLYAEERKSMEDNVTRRWEADMKSDYWLPSNIRPLVLTLLSVSVVTFAAIDGMDNVPFTLGPRWIDLLTTLTSAVFVAYFGGRSWEKVKRSI